MSVKAGLYVGGKEFKLADPNGLGAYTTLSYPYSEGVWEVRTDDFSLYTLVLPFILWRYAS